MRDGQTHMEFPVFLPQEQTDTIYILYIGVWNAIVVV